MPVLDRPAESQRFPQKKWCCPGPTVNVPGEENEPMDGGSNDDGPTSQRHDRFPNNPIPKSPKKNPATAPSLPAAASPPSPVNRRLLWIRAPLHHPARWRAMKRCTTSPISILAAAAAARSSCFGSDSGGGDLRHAAGVLLGLLRHGGDEPRTGTSVLLQRRRVEI